MIEANGISSFYKGDHDDDHEGDDDDLDCWHRKDILAMIPPLPRAPV